MAADDQKDFWGQVTKETVMVRIACDRADAAATAVCRATSAGFGSAETHHQVADIIRDDNIELLREYEANRA